MAVTVKEQLTAWAERLRTMNGVQYTTLHMKGHVASDDTEVIGEWVAPVRCYLLGAYVVPRANTSGADTNTTQLNLINGGVSGTGTTVVASLLLSNNNNLAAGKKSVITESLQTQLEAGSVVKLQAQKVGNGGNATTAEGSWVVVWRGR